MSSACIVYEWLPIRGKISYRVMCKIGVAVVAIVPGHYGETFEGPEAPAMISDVNKLLL